MTYGIGVEYKKLMINVSGKNMGIIAEDEGPGDVKDREQSLLSAFLLTVLISGKNKLMMK